MLRQGTAAELPNRRIDGTISAEDATEGEATGGKSEEGRLVA